MVKTQWPAERRQLRLGFEQVPRRHPLQESSNGQYILLMVIKYNTLLVKIQRPVERRQLRLGFEEVPRRHPLHEVFID